MLRRLDFFYRWVGTFIAFIGFFNGCLLLSTFAFPIISTTTKCARKREKRTQYAIHQTFKLYIRFIKTLRLISLTHSNIRALKSCKGKIIIANHPSLIDVVILMSYVPNAYCVVKHELWGHRFLGKIVRTAGYIPNNLDAETMVNTCKEISERGANLIIFPEGTRTSPGTELKFQRSFAQLAIMAGVTLKPIIIRCNEPFLTKCRPWYKLPIKRAHFHITAEKPIDVTTYNNKPRSIAAREITRSLQGHYVEKLQHARA